MTNGNSNGATEASLVVPVKVAQAVVDYLQQQKYGEVAGLIAALAQCKSLDDYVKTTLIPKAPEFVSLTPEVVADYPEVAR